MAGPMMPGESRVAAPTGGTPQPYGKALALLASLFFMWGFITVLNDILIPHLKGVFSLNYTQALLVQMAWFIGYFVASIPAAKLIERIGYKRAMVAGLIIMAVGALGFLPASQFVSYPVFLGALFVVACGVAVLQVAANPYVTVIGPPETASSRLNLVQALNSAGTFVAPVFGAFLILSRSSGGGEAGGPEVLSEAQKLADAHAVQLPYMMIAVVLLVLAAIIYRFRLPELSGATQRLAAEERRHHSLWKHRNL